jgi:hypothetical protein
MEINLRLVQQIKGGDAKQKQHQESLNTRSLLDCSNKWFGNIAGCSDSSVKKYDVVFLGMDLIFCISALFDVVEIHLLFLCCLRENWSNHLSWS